MEFKQYDEYVEQVVAQLPSKRFKDAARRELMVKIAEFHAMAERNGAIGSDAVGSTLKNMGAADELANLLTQMYSMHLSNTGTIGLAALIALFFILMGIFSSGTIFTQIKPLTILIMLTLTAVFSLVRNAHRLTLQGFISSISFGGALTGFSYAIFHLYLFYFDSSMERAKELVLVRGNIEQLLLIIVYGFIIALAGDVATKRLYPPVDTFVTEIFEDKKFKALRNNSRMIFVTR